MGEHQLNSVLSIALCSHRGITIMPPRIHTIPDHSRPSSPAAENRESKENRVLNRELKDGHATNEYCILCCYPLEPRQHTSKSLSRDGVGNDFLLISEGPLSSVLPCNISFHPILDLIPPDTTHTHIDPENSYHRH